MPILDDDLNLEKRRREAGLSQADMATFLGVSQSQVSRYEQDPDNVPAGILRKWLQLCGDVAASKGLDVDDPRTVIKNNIKLIKDYVSVEPTLNGKIYLRNINVPSADYFLKSVYTAARKPRVGVFGKFDSGKSSLLNVLFGKKRLPTSFQPTTSTISLIRHISDKPSWQAEDVWIMKPGFNLDKADDEAHCRDQKLLAGGYETLNQYGTHQGAGKTEEAFAAVVYIDAPLLTCADFLDLPGYGHNEEDEKRADIKHNIVDVLMYLSPFTGFMDQNDLLYLSVLLRNLPYSPADDLNTNSLRNLYVVATHSHHAQPQTREAMLQEATVRCIKHLDKVLEYRAIDSTKQISQEEFRQRFFTFSVDDAGIRNEFEGDLIELLTQILPQRCLRTLDIQVKAAKKCAKDAWDNELSKLLMVMQQRTKAQAEYKTILDMEPQRLAKNKFQEKKISNLIDEFEKEGDLFITQTFSKHTSVSAIEAMIRHRYNDKKEAQKLAGTYLLEVLQGEIEKWVRIKSNVLGKTIDNFLEGYGPPKVDGSQFTDVWTFNARAAFMGALSGLSTVGALTAWAAIAAAGSNLGGYILVAQAVGWLASLGISLGGSATVISFVSALGGPLTIAVGLGAIVAAGVWTIFGDSWQTKLAKKINTVLSEKEVEQQFKVGIAKFWADTRNGFNIAVQKTEETFQEQLKVMEGIAFSSSSDDIERAYQYAQEMRDFFGGIPWKSFMELPYKI